MKNTWHFFALATAAICFCAIASAGTTITYSYDAQDRLTAAQYSDTEKAFYGYDSANNLDLYVVVTDRKYLKSFLLFLSISTPVPGSFQLPAWLAACAGMQVQYLNNMHDRRAVPAISGGATI